MGSEVKYILINVNYDSGETEKSQFANLDELKSEFDEDEILLGELLNEGEYEWEWGVYHLINLGDYI